MANNPKILYVEDDTFSREIMEVLLRDVLQYEDVTIWPDSADFEDRLNDLSYVPDIIFLDIHVEPIDGFAMLEICKGRGELSNTKVIALTASIMATEVDDLHQAGFDGLIGKPVNQQVFPETIQEILSGQNVWEEAWD